MRSEGKKQKNLNQRWNKPIAKDRQAIALAPASVSSPRTSKFQGCVHLIERRVLPSTSLPGAVAFSMNGHLSVDATEQRQGQARNMCGGLMLGGGLDLPPWRQ